MNKINMIRAQKIANGLLWTVHTHESIQPEKTFFEGSKSACIRWLKENRRYRDYKRGIGVRLGKIIWEP